MKNINRIQCKIDKDHGILLTSQTLAWSCGFFGDGSALLLKDKFYLFTDGRFIEEAQATGADTFIGNMQEQQDALIKIVAENKILKIGICPDDFTYTQGRKLAQTFDICDADFTQLREIKQDFETKRITHCADITQNCFDSVLGIIKPGVTEADISAHILHFIAKNGAQPSFEPIVASGENGSMPHAGVTERKVLSGDLITMDFGCKKNGYCSDFTRTVAVQTLEHSTKVVYNICKSACESALEALAAGKRTADIDAVARKVIVDAGYGQYFLHGLGHGVGSAIHEAPRLSGTSDETLKQGNVVTVEPGIYIKGKFGVRIEDMVLITNSGYKNFYTATRELITVG